MNFQIIGSDGKIYGPVTAEILRDWIAQGRVDARTPVLMAGASSWSVMGAVPEFAASFHGRPPVSSPPPGTISAYPQPSRVHSLATAGLILGIISWCCCCCCGGFPFNLLGLIFSIVALLQISEKPELYSGRPQAIVGIVLSSVSLLFSLIWIASNHSTVYYNGHGY